MIRIHPPKGEVDKEKVDLASANIRSMMSDLPFYRQILIERCGADVYLNTIGRNCAHETFNPFAKKQKPFYLNLSIDDFSSFTYSKDNPSVEQRYHLATLKEETMHNVQTELTHHESNSWLAKIEWDLSEKNILREELEKKERYFTSMPIVKEGIDNEYVRAKILLSDYGKLTRTGQLKAKYAAGTGVKNAIMHHVVDIAGKGEDTEKMLHESPADVERIRDFLIHSDWIANQTKCSDVDEVMLAAFPHSYKGFKDYEEKLTRYAELLCDVNSPLERPETWREKVRRVMGERHSMDFKL